VAVLDALEKAGLSSAEFRACEARQSEDEVLPNADPRVALPIGERQYHIGLGPGELAEYILLPGDPDRTARIATRLDDVETERRHREFASVTGTYRGIRVSVVSTGIGTDNVEITVAEILAITERPTFVRVGSCGTLQPEVALGDLIISTGAVRLESTTSYYVHDGYPAVADYEAVLALIEAAELLGNRTHVGLTATAPGFFGAQGRPIPQLPIRYPDLAEDMARQRVMNFEMEASALLVLASLARCRAGVVCAVYAQRTTGEFIEGAAKDQAEAACVETGLEALRILAEMDRQKRIAGTDRWRPSLWNRT
jgi:uridine phosphorylase